MMRTLRAFGLKRYAERERALQRQINTDLNADWDRFVADEEAASSAYFDTCCAEEQADDEAVWATWKAEQDQLARREQEAEVDRLEDDLYFADVPEDDLEDGVCNGICDEQVSACNCAEIEALIRHNANPATQGSWFVA